MCENALFGIFKENKDFKRNNFLAKRTIFLVHQFLHTTSSPIYPTVLIKMGCQFRFMTKQGGPNKREVYYVHAKKRGSPLILHIGLHPSVVLPPTALLLILFNSTPISSCAHRPQCLVILTFF